MGNEEKNSSEVGESVVDANKKNNKFAIFCSP